MFLNFTLLNSFHMFNHYIISLMQVYLNLDFISQQENLREQYVFEVCFSLILRYTSHLPRHIYSARSSTSFCIPYTICTCTY